MGMIKPNLCRRLITLSVRLTDYVKACGRDKELADVLPVLCYDKLICKGIRLDPSLEDVYAAMTQMGQNATLRGLLHALLGAKPLAMYTLKTGKGIRTQVRARMFAADGCAAMCAARRRLCRDGRNRRENQRDPAVL